MYFDSGDINTSVYIIWNLVGTNKPSWKSQDKRARVNKPRDEKPVTPNSPALEKLLPKWLVVGSGMAVTSKDNEREKKN